MLCGMNTTRRVSVCVLGSANMDLVVTVERAPRLGETVRGTRFVQVPGGKGANQALAAARAGADVRMIGAVGNDEFGSRIRAVLAADRIDTTGLLTVDEPTGTAHILVDDHGENAIVVVPGANGSLRAVTDDQRAAITAADVLLLQLEVPYEVVSRAAQWASTHGTTVVLTPAPVVPLDPDLLGAVDLLVPNEHEAAQITDEDDVHAAARELVRRGVVGAVVVTMGHRGCLYADRSRVLEMPAVQVEAVDTTAAGDTFVAALSVALAEGRQVEESLSWATAAAAISVQRHGASTSMPYRAEIDSLLSTRPRAE
jgi:ribokinase